MNFLICHINIFEGSQSIV